MKWLSVLMTAAALLAGAEESGATGTAQPLTPAGDVTAAQPVFAWTAGSDATWYHLWINKDGQYYYAPWVQGSSWTPTVRDPPCTSGTSRVACAPSSVPQNQCPIIRSPWGSGG